MDDNNFEQYPGVKVESVGEREVAPSEDFEKSFETGVPPFAGEQGGEVQYGQATAENLYYGEAKDDEEIGDMGEQYDAGIADAAAIINYGQLDAVARELGVGKVIRTIKEFDLGGRENPIKDLLMELGIDTSEEVKSVQEEGAATRTNEQMFREGVNNPGQRRSPEGANKAVEDLKNLIRGVEGADPRFEALRDEARKMQEDVFDWAVKKYATRGLTELFSVLAEQREKADEVTGETGETEKEVVGEMSGEVSGADDKIEELAKTEMKDEDGKEQDLPNDEQRETLNPEILQKQM